MNNIFSVTEMPVRNGSWNFFNLLIFIFLMSQACKSDNEGSPAVPKPNLLVSANEEGAIYLDGIYTGKTTPAELTVGPGEYVVGYRLKYIQKIFAKNGYS